MHRQLALAAVVGHVHLAAQHLFQALLHLHRQRAAGCGFAGLLGGLCHLFAKRLGLTDVQLVVRDDLRGFGLQFRCGQTQHHLGVAGIDKTALQQFQHRFR